MKIKFYSCKGRRIKKQFMWVELNAETEPFWFEYMYFPETKVWRKEGLFEKGETIASSICRCRSLKAAIRLIKKWNFPKGTTFRLVSRFGGGTCYGYDVLITV